MSNNNDIDGERGKLAIKEIRNNLHKAESEADKFNIANVKSYINVAKQFVDRLEIMIMDRFKR